MQKNKPSIIIYFLTIIFCFSLNNCGGMYAGDVIDPSGHMTRKDYLELRQRGTEGDDIQDEKSSSPLNKNESKKTKNKLHQSTSLDEPPIPDMPSLLSPPEHKSLLSEKRVSVTLTEDVPLRDVLIQIGREAQISMALDPRIQGGVIFTAHEQPFEEVLQKICALAGLRYRNDDNYLRIELDEPYQKTYAVDYPSLSRQTNSEISISTNVFDADTTGSSSGKMGGNSGSNNNSTAKISAQSAADFWAELEKTLPRLMTSSKQNTPLIKKNIETPLQPNTQQDQNYSMDKQAGIVTIFGTEQQHKAIASYLAHLRHKATRQVLIEARIVEVELSDGFQSGVNWQALLDKSANIAASLSAGGLAASAANGVFTAGFGNSDFSGILKLVRSFGTTRVLSSPRLTVLNNQTAVLKVARNEVYFITQAQYSTTTNASGVPVSGTPVFSSTPHTVPVGLIMAVQPAIDPERGIVTMTLRPTISRVVDHISDPSISLNAAGAGLKQSVESRIPVLAVREMDSVLQLKSGEVAVMGGLMQDSSENKDQGLPPFDAMPVLGNLAKSRDNNGTTSELVILLRATILDNAGPDNADIELYKKYNRDPRPLSFSATSQ